MARVKLSITEIPLTTSPVETIDESPFEIELGDEQPHLECCRVERFFCGRPYHPELSALEMDAPEDEVCAKCMKILHAHACWRGHQHCPIPLMQGFVCPDARA